MNMKKTFFLTSSAITLASFVIGCHGSGITHPRSSVNPVYTADLNHNGTIEDNERNLTWSQSYDVLMAQSNSMIELSKAADSFNIASDELRRTSLARYEILHQAEELAMSTGAVYPLYSYGSAYLFKENLTGVYSSPLGYRFLNRMYDVNNPTTPLERISATVGTRAESFDPATNTDVSTSIILNHFMCGAKCYVPSDELEHDNDPKIVKAKIVDGLCNVSKKLLTSDSTLAQDTTNYLLINGTNTPDIQDAIDAGVATAQEYELTARYTLNIKNDAKWSNGDPILAEDFVYNWTRASSATYNGQAFGYLSFVFDSIRGYDAWSAIGQQTSKNPEEWDEIAKENWDSLSPELQKKYSMEYGQCFDKNGCAGGMAGVMASADNKSITVQLINDCDYFSDLLTFSAFMPVDKSSIIQIPNGKTDKEVICEEDPAWWMNGDTYHTCGIYEIDGNIENYESGKIKLKKSSNCVSSLQDNMTVKNITFHFIDSDITGYEEFKKSGGLDYCSYIPTSMMDYEKERNREYHSSQTLGTFYHHINVNDNTFDYKAGLSERDRENLRWAFILLVNRRDIVENIVKAGSIPCTGAVSSGITETCVPYWDSGSNSYKAKKENGEYVTADWHERNLDTYQYLINGNDYNSHILSNRTSGGFFPLHEEIDVSPEVNQEDMKRCCDRAIELAKAAGIDYDERTGKFTNFPRVTISTNNNAGIEEIIERTQAYYSLWGIDVTIKTEEWQAYSNSTRIGDFAVGRQGWLADYNDARTYLDCFGTNNANNRSQLGRDNWHFSH